MIGFLVRCALFAFILLPACAPDYEDRYHTVASVTADGSLLLQDGVMVELAGVTPTESSRGWLRDHIAGQRVRLAYDSQHYPDEDAKEVTAYVLTANGTSVNGYLLSAQLAPVATEAFDSSFIFRAYAAGQHVTGPEVAPTAVDDKKEADEEESETPATLSDLADLARPAVGLVLVRDAKSGSVFQGTAFFVRPDGLAVTNYHVLAGADKGIMRLADGRELPIIEWVDASERYDYATFRVGEANGQLPYLSIASQTPRQAEEVYVIGNPSGLISTFTRGVVSALRSKDDDQASPPDALIQIDAAISHGSSGSPVLNRQGQVVGLASFGKRDCSSCNFAYNIQLLNIKKYR